MGFKFLDSFRIAMLSGAVWGFLTYAFYSLIIGQLPLPISVFLAPTIFFPGMLGHIIVVNTFSRFRVVDGQLPMYIYVPSLFTEMIGSLLAMLFGLGIVYVLWRMYNLK